MPTVSVDKENFFASLGKTYTTQEFDELCFQFGIELDDDTTEECLKAGQGERPQLKIDIPANRYDLLCHEGIARALLVFQGKIPQPNIRLTKPAAMCEIHVDDKVASIRPVILGAILRNVTFTPENYASFIDLQDKLHQNLGRRRTLVSMGTHDLDTIEAPFLYEGLAPKDVKFAPLNRPGQVMDGPTLMTTLDADRHLSRYLPIIRDSPVYPVVLDKNRTVCSLPPVINSEHSKITLNTKNVFIDMTGTDETRCIHALAELVGMISQYCGEQYTVEPVKVVYPGGRTEITPNLTPRHTTARLSYINRCTGLDLTRQRCTELLARMGHEAASNSADEDLIDIAVPATRPDILHECDIMEDVAVAYGFDNLPRRFPATNTVASPLPVNKLSDIVRREIAYAGWVEGLSLILCSHDENYAWLNQKDPGTEAILLENPKSLEYQLVRTSLLPGLLKTLRENRKHSLPLRLFEVSDVGYKDESETERCARNERRVVASYTDKEARFEVVHGLLDRIMRVLGVEFIGRTNNAGKERGYWIEESDDATFLPGRAAVIKFRPGPSKTDKSSDASASRAADTLASAGASGAQTSAPLPTHQPTSEAQGATTASSKDESKLGSAAPPAHASSSSSPSVSSALDHLGRKLATALHLSSSASPSSREITIGKLGVLHPEVLKKFDIDWPTAALEFDLEVFV
ncbi:unnamed protein product [Parajaminaea phylloscopi]